MLIWDRHHAGKRSRPSDMGAAADIDGDTVVEIWEREAELTPQYIATGRDFALAQGIRAEVIDPLGAGLRADYDQRHRQACALAGTAAWAAYLACHLNSGGGNYALVGWDPDRPTSRELALAIATELERLIPVISRCRVEALTGAWVRGLPTIRGLRAGPPHLAGVLLEPLFLDDTDHQQYIVAGGLAEVGRACALGAISWGSAHA